MNQQQPFLPIYDLSDSPPDDPSMPTSIGIGLPDVLADALDALNTDYDGICICFSDGRAFINNQFFEMLMGDML
jgi:hypothetical protein